MLSALIACLERSKKRVYLEYAIVPQVSILGGLVMRAIRSSVSLVPSCPK